MCLLSSPLKNLVRYGTIKIELKFSPPPSSTFFWFLFWSARGSSFSAGAGQNLFLRPLLALLLIGVWFTFIFRGDSLLPNRFWLSDLGWIWFQKFRIYGLTVWFSYKAFLLESFSRSVGYVVVAGILCFWTGLFLQVLTILSEFDLASICPLLCRSWPVRLDLAEICCWCRFIPRLSMIVVDQAASRSVSKNLYLPVYEVLVGGSLRCFLRVLGGGVLAVVWPRAFPLSSCHICSIW